MLILAVTSFLAGCYLFWGFYASGWEWLYFFVGLCFIFLGSFLWEKCDTKDEQAEAVDPLFDLINRIALLPIRIIHNFLKPLSHFDDFFD
jgi:hypothetical protein